MLSLIGDFNAGRQCGTVMILCVSPALRSRRSRLAPTGRQGQLTATPATMRDALQLFNLFANALAGAAHTPAAGCEKGPGIGKTLCGLIYSPLHELADVVRIHIGMPSARTACMRSDDRKGLFSISSLVTTSRGIPLSGVLRCSKKRVLRGSIARPGQVTPSPRPSPHPAGTRGRGGVRASPIVGGWGAG